MDSSNSKRLNPFAFPVETDTLFTLFVLAAIMFVLNWLPVIGAIVAEMLVGHDVPTSSISDNPMVIIGFPALLLAVATVLLFAYPRRIIRAERLTPFDPATDTAFAQELDALKQRAQVGSNYTVMLRKTNQLDGRAFGGPRHFVLRLDEGLRLALRRAPAMMRALTLHELAHLFNRDVVRTYYAQALWTTLVVVVFLPYLAILFLNYIVGTRLAKLAQGTATADVAQNLVSVLPAFVYLVATYLISLLIVLLLRASLLRAREGYADWRTVFWGEEDGLLTLLKAAASFHAPPGRRERLRDLARLHPSPAERLGAVQNPLHLLRVSNGLPFFVGWLAVVTLFGLSSPYLGFLSRWTLFTGTWPVEYIVGLPASQRTLIEPVLFVLLTALTVVLAVAPSLAIGYAVMGSLGNAVQWQAISSSFRGQPGIKPYIALLIPALSFVIGLYVGIATIPLAGIAIEVLQGVQVGFWLALPLLVVGVWLCLCLIHLFSVRLLGKHVGRKSPHWKRRSLSALTTLLLGLFLTEFFLVTLINSSQGALITSQADAEITEMVRSLLLILPLLAFCLGIGFLTATLVALFIWRGLRPLRCPHCQQRVKQSAVLGQECAVCQGELTEWALATIHPTPGTAAPGVA